MAQYRIGALMVGALGSMCALISPAAEAPAPAPEPAPALAPEPAFSFDGTPGRLPKNVVPERYEVAITPNMKTMIIAGRESVTLRIRANTDRLVLNSLNETLTRVRFDGQPVASVASDDKEQLTTVRLSHPRGGWGRIGSASITAARSRRGRRGCSCSPSAYAGGPFRADALHADGIHGCEAS